MSAGPVTRPVLAFAWLLALFSLVLFYLSITADARGVGPLTFLAHWAWASVAALVLVAGWAALLVVHGRAANRDRGPTPEAQ